MQDKLCEPEPVLPSTFHDVALWPDARLIETIRRDPPDELALQVLTERYLKVLFRRCLALTSNPNKADDLAQDTWFRVLRARRSLRPDGNFRALLYTIASNLWRDIRRSARRAGVGDNEELVSLDKVVVVDNGDAETVGDNFSDTKPFYQFELTLLKIDLHQALDRLSPHLHEVLVLRFIHGESCAEIGKRYQRTEQTVSGWVRQGIASIKNHLEN